MASGQRSAATSRSELSFKSRDKIENVSELIGISHKSPVNESAHAQVKFNDESIT